MNDHLLITKVGNPDVRLPTGEPVAKVSQTAPETICDPRHLLVVELVGSALDVTEGDWVAASGWTRPRRVEFVDTCEAGAVLHIADPDEGRTNDYGVRRLDPEGWQRRAPWRRYPNLRCIWDAAHEAGV